MNKILLVMMCSILSMSGYAQLVDDFSDGDFMTNPSWNGDVSNYLVVGGSLKSNGPPATASIYLSTPSVAVNNTSWEFFIQMDFAPSSSNQARVYLVSDNNNLNEPLNGYFIAIGQSSDDQINFYRQDGTSSTLLFGGSTFFTTTPVVARIRVVRDDLGNWEIAADATGGTIFSSEGASFFDNTYTSTSFFGIVCKHTSTRRDLFYYDDIMVTLPPDNTPPSLVSISQISTTELDLQFNEELNSTSTETVTNYVVNNGIGNPSSAVLDVSDNTLVHLIFSTAFNNNTDYVLSTEKLEDTNGNIASLETKGFTFLIPELAEIGNIIINEIFADPTPQVDLPETEYVEIYNRSNKYIDLANYSLNGAIILNEEYIIAPNDYLILCDDSNETLMSPFGEVIGVVYWDILTNTGETITLKDENNNLVIDKLTYNETWYGDVEKANGGYSLELINPNSLCEETHNWTASINSVGGTPGAQNSVYGIDEQAPELKVAIAEDVDSLALVFDENIVGDYGSEIINITPNVEIIEVITNGNMVLLKLLDDLQTGIAYSVSVNGQSDCAGNVIIDSQTITFRLPDSPEPKDIIINELMADPFDQVGLPESEFVELYNRSNKYFNLADLTINGKSIINNYFEFAPDSYIILCSEENTETFENYGMVVGLISWDPLTNGGETITLNYLGNNLVIDQLTYNSTWYGDVEKANGGYSLELINPNSLCEETHNWTASINSVGGTPGTQNSVYGIDEQAPELKVAIAEGVDSLVLVFDEELVADLGNGVLNITPSANITQVNSLDNMILLKLQDNLQTGIAYSVSVNGQSDCAGNVITDSQTVTFRLPDSPEPKDIIINELMADPFDQVGLPESEFVELYNRSNKYFNLADLTINGKSIITNYFEFTPDSYVILCPSEFVLEFQVYGTTIGLELWDVLTNSGEQIVLYDLKNGVEIDELSYSLSWYNSSFKDDGGWTLELIDSENLCNSEDNWTASVNPNGGTPGTENSVKASKPDLSGPRLLDVIAVSPDTLQLIFNENLDSLSILSADYTINEIEIDHVKIESLKQVFLILNSALEASKTYRTTVNNLKDCSGNSITSESNSMDFVLPEVAALGDIVLNEILFNPRSEAPDFVELYNKSEKYIDLQGWMITNKNDSGEPNNAKIIRATPFVMKPNTFIVITTNIDDLANEYPSGKTETFMNITSLPTFANDKGSVVLLMPDTSIYTEFDYHEDFHHALLNSVEGISLERIDIDGSTNDSNNWHSAASTVRATPGYVNSQVKGAITTEKVLTVTPKVIIPNQNGVDDYATLHYEFSHPGYVVSMRIIDDRGRVIKSIIEQQTLPISGAVYWDGTSNDGKKARIGSYMVFVEVFDMQGSVNHYRERVVVGSEW